MADGVKTITSAEVMRAASGSLVAMKLRLLVVALLLANLGYCAWSHGGLTAFGAQPARFGEREPQRLQQQVRHQMLEIPARTRSGGAS